MRPNDQCVAARVGTEEVSSQKQALEELILNNMTGLNRIKRELIRFGMHHKARIKKIPFLHKSAKAIYRMFSSAPGKRESVYLGDYKALTTTIWGHRIFVDTRDISLTPQILLEGYWEPLISQVFAETVKEGMTVVEVGANIGYYTLIAASKIGPKGRVYAFEANPHACELLYQSVAINSFLDRVTLINKAVSYKSGTLKFHNLRRYLGGSSAIEFSSEFLKHFRDEMETIEMESISLDDYFADNPTKIDLIKIDSEGSEAHILKGMREIIRNNPQLCIVCEFSPALVRAMGDDPKIVLEEIASYGFKLKIINPNCGDAEVAINTLLNMDQCELFLRR